MLTIQTPHLDDGVLFEKREKASFLIASLKEFLIPDLVLDKVRTQHNWSYSGTALAFEEYLRFIVLASLGERVVPSVSVDEIWHTHLTFTRNYWDGMCAKILNYPLHHDPSGLVPNQKDRNDYQKTLQFYEDIFQQIPPSEVWGRNTMEELKKKF